MGPNRGTRDTESPVGNKSHHPDRSARVHHQNIRESAIHVQGIVRLGQSRENTPNQHRGSMWARVGADVGCAAGGSKEDPLPLSL